MQFIFANLIGPAVFKVANERQVKRWKAYGKRLKRQQQCAEGDFSNIDIEKYDIDVLKKKAENCFKILYGLAHAIEKKEQQNGIINILGDMLSLGAFINPLLAIPAIAIKFGANQNGSDKEVNKAREKIKELQKEIQKIYGVVLNFTKGEASEAGSATNIIADCLKNLPVLKDVFGALETIHDPGTPTLSDATGRVLTIFDMYCNGETILNGGDQSKHLVEQIGRLVEETDRAIGTWSLAQFCVKIVRQAKGQKELIKKFKLDDKVVDIHKTTDNMLFYSSCYLQISYRPGDLIIFIMEAWQWIILAAVFCFGMFQLYQFSIWIFAAVLALVIMIFVSGYCVLWILEPFFALAECLNSCKRHRR